MSYTLRPYQDRAVLACTRFLKNPQRGNGIAVLPSGAGKSLVIANIVKELGAPTLVFQPSKELLEQNHAKMESYGYSAGIYSASFNRKQIAPITFATIGSVKSHPELFGIFKYIIADECHTINAKQGMYANFLAAMDGIRVLGLTATPYRLVTDNYGGSILKFLTRTRPRVFEDVVYCVQNRSLFDAGFLAQIDYLTTAEFDRSQIKLNSTGADYDDASVKAYYQRSGFVNKVIGAADTLLQTRKNALIFTRFIEEAEAITAALPGSAIVTSKTSKTDRAKLIHGFRQGVIKAVVNVGVLCLDDKTEILTASGWTGIDDMTYEHNVACWSMDGSVIFSPPKFIIRRDRMYGERMVYARGNAIDFRVTEDHRVVRSRGRDLSWGVSLASEVVGKLFQFPSAGYSAPFPVQLETAPISDHLRNKRITANAYNYRQGGMESDAARKLAREVVDGRLSTYTQPQELTLDECRFIGFWLADGSLSCGSCVVSQSKRYENIIRWFDGVIGRIGLHHTKREVPKRGNLKFDVVIWDFAKGTGCRSQKVDNGCFRLLPYLNKHGANILWGIDREQYGALLEGFWYGDGEHGTTDYATSHNRRRVRGTQRDLYDLLQSIGTCRGYRVIIRPVTPRANPRHSRQWAMRWCDCQRTSIGWAKPQFETDWKEERVWCVTSETSFIITRRNGIVTITGNTTGFDYPELETIILARPTMSLALYTQMVGRGVRVHPDKENTVVLDMCGNVRNFGPIEDLKLVDGGHSKWFVESHGKQLTNIYFGGGKRWKGPKKKAAA